MLLIVKNIINNIKRNSTLFIVLLITFFLGILFGFFITLDNFNDFFIENVISFYNLALAKNNSPIKYLFLNLIYNLLLFVIIFVVSLNKFTYFFNFCILFLKGFSLIFGFRCFFITFGFGGVFLFLLLLAIDVLISSLAIIIYLVNTYKRVVSGCCNNNYLLKSLLLSLVISIIGTLIEFIFLVFIFRPFIFFY